MEKLVILFKVNVLVLFQLKFFGEATVMSKATFILDKAGRGFFYYRLLQLEGVFFYSSILIYEGLCVLSFRNY